MNKNSDSRKQEGQTGTFTPELQAELSPESIRLYADLLSEMGAPGNVTCGLIHDTDGKPLIGDNRTPVLVQNGDIKFVIKPYEGNNGKLKRSEAAIVRRISGSPGPEILFAGTSGFAEEFINPAEHTILYRIAENSDKALDLAFAKGGEGFGILTVQGVFLDHLHWIDEFHVHNTSLAVRVTDFGKATLIKNEQKYLLSKQRKSNFHDDGLLDYIRLNLPHEDRKFDMQLAQIAGAIRQLGDDPNVQLNHIGIILNALSGMKYYFKSIGQDLDAWNLTTTYAPSFVESYVSKVTAQFGSHMTYKAFMEAIK